MTTRLNFVTRSNFVPWLVLALLRYEYGHLYPTAMYLIFCKYLLSCNFRPSTFCPPDTREMTANKTEGSSRHWQSNGGERHNHNQAYHSNYNKCLEGNTRGADGTEEPDLIWGVGKASLNKWHLSGELECRWRAGWESSRRPEGCTKALSRRKVAKFEEATSVGEA